MQRNDRQQHQQEQQKGQIILATAGYDKQIKFWDIRNQNQPKESKEGGEHAIT